VCSTLTGPRPTEAQQPMVASAGCSLRVASRPVVVGGGSGHRAGPAVRSVCPGPPRCSHLALCHWAARHAASPSAPCGSRHVARSGKAEPTTFCPATRNKIPYPTRDLHPEGPTSLTRRTRRELDPDSARSEWSVYRRSVRGAKWLGGGTKTSARTRSQPGDSLKFLRPGLGPAGVLNAPAHGSSLPTPVLAPFVSPSPAGLAAALPHPRPSHQRASSTSPSQVSLDFPLLIPAPLVVKSSLTLL
jgi:hypothetical protein